MGEKYMDFKKLFRKDEKAVSPVIGVILMVAITVILAAAIGSSVFSKGTAEAAPQASLNMKADGTYSSSKQQAVVRIEHLGGDAINLNSNSTKLMITIDNELSKPATADNNVTSGDNILEVGDTKAFKVKETSGSEIKVTSGQIANIKFIDVQTNQLICDKNVRF
jgi:flagellin-like protein